MRIWSNAVIAELRVSNCAECPDHKKVQVRRKAATGWVTEISHVSCRKTGRSVTLMEIGDGCPLPEVFTSEKAEESPLTPTPLPQGERETKYLTTEKADNTEDKEITNERTD